MIIILLVHIYLVEVIGEEVDVDGGGHEDELEIFAMRQQLAQNAEKEVAEQMAFVDLV